MPQTQSIEDLVGSCLVIGFPGTKVTPEVVEQFKRTRAGGVIFFRINFESPEQIRTVIADLDEALGRKLLVCVDHEGGRVIMYRDGITVFPDNHAFGRVACVEEVRKMASIAAKELRALGTDVNFAPTIDVLTSSYSPNIGIRAFSSDSKRVSEMGTAYIEAMQAGGVSATAKHFPGSGHNVIDAHLNLPTVDLGWDEMKAVHLAPFADAIKSGVDVIMSSHPLYPKLDPTPGAMATFSRRIIHDTLRAEMGFKGVISSDDLEMGAIRESIGIGPAAVKTAAAGHDLILSCHDFQAQRDVYTALVAAYKSGVLKTKDLEDSAARVEALRAKRPTRFEGKIGPDPEGAPLAAAIARRAVETIKDPHQLLPLSGENRAAATVVFPRLSDLSKRIMIEADFDDEKKFIASRWPGKAPAIELYGLEVTDAEIEAGVRAATNAKVTVFFCFDAHLHPRQKILMQRLRDVGRRLIIVLMRDPYDRSLFGQRDTGLAIFGFRKCQVEGALSRIFGEPTA